MYFSGGAAAVGTSGNRDLTPATGSGVVVSGNQKWTPSGLTVRKGDRLNFTANGEIQLSADGNDVANAAGAQSKRTAAGSPLPNAYAGALIGRVGTNGPVFADRQPGFVDRPGERTAVPWHQRRRDRRQPWRVPGDDPAGRPDAVKTVLPESCTAEQGRGFRGPSLLCGGPVQPRPLASRPAGDAYNRGWFLSVIVLVRSFPSAVCRHAPAAHPDAGPRAVLRAAGHAFQRIPPDQGAHRARPPRRSGDVSGRRRRRVAEPADHSLGASAGNQRRADRSVVDQGGARRVPGGDRSPAGAPREVRRDPFARGSGPAGRVAVAQAGHSAPLRHALEPAAAALQLQVRSQRLAAKAVRAHGAPDGVRFERRHHHLPGPLRSRAHDGRRRSGDADRERDGRRRRGSSRSWMPPKSARAGASRPRRGSSSTRARSSRTRGWICSIDAMAIVSRRHPDATLLVVGGRPEQVEALRAAATSKGGRIVFTGLSAGARHRRLCRRCRRARVAAHRRDQHAAEDLLLPARGAADRRHRSPDPHAGAQLARRRCSCRRRRRPLPAPSRACSTIRRSPSRLAQAAAELARSRYSREEYVARTVRACERLVQAGAARA